MNRFLLLALTAGLISPIAANAETYWLILVAGQNLQKVEMKTMDHCKEQGEKWRKDKSEGINRSGPVGRFFYCIEGK